MLASRAPSSAASCAGVKPLRRPSGILARTRVSALEEETPEEKGATAHKLAETLRWNGCNASSQPVDPDGRVHLADEEEAAEVLERVEQASQMIR